MRWRGRGREFNRDRSNTEAQPSSDDTNVSSGRWLSGWHMNSLALAHSTVITLCTRCMCICVSFVRALTPARPLSPECFDLQQQQHRQHKQSSECQAESDGHSE